MSHDPTTIRNTRPSSSITDPCIRIRMPAMHGTNYEGTDASVKIVLGSLVIIAVTLVFLSRSRYRFTVLKDANPPGNFRVRLLPRASFRRQPLLKCIPGRIPGSAAHSKKRNCNSTGRTPDGHVHIPIDSAMDAVVSQLNITADAPPGYHGAGRTRPRFRGQLASMPPAYQTPTGHSAARFKEKFGRMRSHKLPH